MSDVRCWFTRWLRRHVAMIPHGQWPVPGTDEARVLYGAWADHLGRAGVTEEVANAASDRMAADPPRFVCDHLPAVLAFAEARRREAEIGDSVAVRVARRAVHDRLCERRAELRRRWGALPDAERAAVRAAVLAENPALATVPRFLELACVDAAGEQSQADHFNKVS